VPVQRYCFVRLAEPHIVARAAIAAEVRATLEAAGAVAEVGEPADDSAARWDLAIVVRCVDLPAWQRLAATPAISALFAHTLPARAVVIKAWTFATP